MARITEKGISGLVGNVIFYTSNGQNYIRSKPRKKNKKKGDPVNPLNTIFGAVSTYGSGMIKRMSGSFLFRFNLATYNLGRGWMRNQYAAHKDDAIWELSARNNTMCQLNSETDLRDFLGTAITVTNDGKGLVRISIPEINPKKDLKAPPRTMRVNLKMIIVTSPFRETEIRNNFWMEQHNFDYSDSIAPSKESILDTKTAEGDIAIVVIALEFETTRSGKGFYNTEKRWLPAAIIAMGRLKN
ncbi:MAG: hypothetical protein ABI760_16415 [Ferruginibacter sp.]